MKPLMLSLLVPAFFLSANGMVAAGPDRARAAQKSPPGRGFEPSVRMQVQSTANNVRMFFWSTGVLCNELVSGAGTGFFPFRSANEYCFGAGLWVGGIVDGLKLSRRGGPDTIAALGYDTSVGAGEYQPGRADQNPASGAARLYDSTDPTDVEEWPPEFRDPGTGEPVIFGQQDIVGSYNDLDPELLLSPSSPSNRFHPLGIQVDQRIIILGLPGASQIFFLIHDITNVSGFLEDGPYDIRDARVGLVMDCDIGPDFGDDRVGFVPEFTPGEPLSNVAFCWDEDFDEQAPFEGTPGFIGYSFLRGPPDPADPTRFLGLTNFTQFFGPSANPGGAPEDPQTDGDAYRLMTPPDQGGVSFVHTIPGDSRFVAASGALDLPAGQTRQVIVALLFARSVGKTSGDTLGVSGTPPNPAPDDPALAELKAVQATALLLFNAQFTLPVPPPKPRLTLLPGENEVTLLWRDVSEVPDPFFRVARQEAFESGEPNPLFNPEYREFDFQGYLVLRSFSGNPNADLDTLARFDLADGITSALQPSDSLFVPELGRFVITQIDTFELGEDTGLAVSFTDRGPRVRNGFPVFYAVQAYDFNGTFFTQPSDREFPGQVFARNPSASVSLISDLFPLQRVVPRSNSSSFRPASSTPPVLQSLATGAILDPTPPTPLTADGSFAGPIPAANWFSASLEVVSGQDFRVPEGTVTVQVDSVRARPARLGVPFCEDVLGTEPGEFPSCDAFEEGDPRGLEPFGFPDTAFQTFVSVRSDGEVLSTFAGEPAVLTFQGIGFIPFGELTTDARSVELGSSETGPVLRVVASVTLGRRADQCSRLGSCEVLDPGGSGLPDGILDFAFHTGLYGGAAAGDVQLTWAGFPGGGLTVSVRDLSNDVPVRFSPRYQSTWGFFPAVTFRLEDAKAVGTTFGGAGIRGFYLDPAIPLSEGCGICPSFAPFRPTEQIYNEIPPAEPGIPHDVLKETADFLQLEDGTFQTRLYLRGEILDAHLSRPPQAGEVWLVRQGYAANHRPTVPGVGIQTTVTPGTDDLADADLSQIRAVPNPYVTTSLFEIGADFQRMEFVNLPPECTLRIYTLSGNLVRILEHTPDEGGTEVWDMQTRFGVRLASGYYYLHVTTPDGRTHMQLFAVISP